jgi:hypothetical protein
MANAVQPGISQTLPLRSVSRAKTLASLAKRVLPHAHFATKAAFSTNRLASRVWPVAPPVGMVSLASLAKPILLWAILSVSNAR